MKKISAILPARGQLDKFERMMRSFVETTRNPGDIEIVCGIDYDDDCMFPIRHELMKKYKDHGLRFMVFTTKSEHFTKHYWNPLAEIAEGRWIFPIACDHEIITKDWDKTLISDMGRRANGLGDDIIHGLIKDNIRRDGEDPLYPHFSCHPVLSKEHVKAIGYFFDERYWVWGPDHAVSWLYRALEDITKEKRIVSLTSIQIVTYDSIHTTKETDMEKLEQMRLADKNYQKFLRISQEHPCTLTDLQYHEEAEKLNLYLKGKRNVRSV